MASDSAYYAKYIGMAKLLLENSRYEPNNIPDCYTEYLSHTYVDGSISLVPLINRFDFSEGIEELSLEEAIEVLGRVNPEDWPCAEDVVSVSPEDLAKVYDEPATDWDFAEDNLGTAEKIEKGLAKVIESVLGEPVERIRGKGGSFPSPDNSFLQETDGTFAGSFVHGDHTFIFEIFPDESGWTVTYRLSPESLDALPPLHQEDREEEDPEKKDYTRRTRNKGWN
jgi:hypothetical protein